MKGIISVSLVASLLASGCSPTVHRGSVAMKINETEAHVCLGKGEVAAGNSIAIFRNVCSPGNSGAKSGRNVSRCEKKLIGRGTITSVLNEHYSVASIDARDGYLEGDIVEKEES